MRVRQWISTLPSRIHLAYFPARTRLLTSAHCRRKPQQKKHKTWDGDAYVTLRADKLTLISEKGMM